MKGHWKKNHFRCLYKEGCHDQMGNWPLNAILGAPNEAISFIVGWNEFSTGGFRWNEFSTGGFPN